MKYSSDINTTLTEAYHETHGAARAERTGNVFTIALMAVFFIVLMACLVSGISIYRGVSEIQANNNAVHMKSGLMTNLVRMNDAVDAVEIGSGPEGDAVVLVQNLESGTYETRIYQFEGAIVQEYAIAGRDYDPENSIKIADSDIFEFVYSDGLLSINTDDGIYRCALRSEQSLSSPTVSSGGEMMADDALLGDTSDSETEVQ